MATRDARAAALWLAAAFLSGATWAASDGGDRKAPDPCPLVAASGDRLLILALDGVPLRVVRSARERGAFPGWGEPVGLISTFPSMTNVAFTAMLDAWGAETIAGYETRHYDLAANRLVGSGGPSGYDWKSLFTVIGDSFSAKRALYLTPEKRSRRVIALVEEALLDRSTPDVVLAHMASTDMLAHLRGDGAMLEIVMEVAEALERIVVEHRERHGRELEVVLLSDHGNGAEKVAYTDGLRAAIRRAGFRFDNRLVKPRSIALPTYGAVSYGALYTDPEWRGELALAAVAHEAVDLAAWIEGERSLSVVGPRGRAIVSWETTPAGRRYAYEIERGDPLRLLEARAELSGRGVLDSHGFASADQWARASLDGWYPLALERLVDSINGRWVGNPATVILSLGPTWAWGKTSVRFGASVMGGRLEGTHGGLDRESSLGFLIGSDSSRQPPSALSVERALKGWLGEPSCLATGPRRGAVHHRGVLHGGHDPR